MIAGASVRLTNANTQEIRSAQSNSTGSYIFPIVAAGQYVLEAEALNPLSGTDTNLDGVTTDRPDVLGNPDLGGGRPRADQIARFFDTAAFVRPAASVLYGNSGRNTVLGPNAVSWNAAAMKEFRVREAATLQFRTDFFNALNQVNLGNPNMTLTNGNFGKITSAAAARMLQFGLKLRF